MAFSCRAAGAVRLLLRTPAGAATLPRWPAAYSAAGARLVRANPAPVLSPLAPVRRLLATAPPAAPAQAATAVKVYVDGVLPAKRKLIGAWLLGCSGAVFGIVVLGGLTRLTESGLSIVEWKPVAGSLPPLNEADWQVEFDKYKQSPEYLLYVQAPAMASGQGARAHNGRW